MLSQCPRYTQNFKNQPVEEVIEFSKPIAGVARKYGIRKLSICVESRGHFLGGLFFGEVDSDVVGW
jgi:hypothetical protein